jgi:hypothetical protein
MSAYDSSITEYITMATLGLPARSAAELPGSATMLFTDLSHAYIEENRGTS